MSIAAAHAARFFTEIVDHQMVWSVRDAEGFPTPLIHSGERAMPFWSTESRARKIIESVPAYKDFTTEGIPLDEFIERWLPGLEKDELWLGINWSGKRAMGYDMTSSEVLARFRHLGLT